MMIHVSPRVQCVATSATVKLGIVRAEAVIGKPVVQVICVDTTSVAAPSSSRHVRVVPSSCNVAALLMGRSYIIGLQ